MLMGLEQVNACHFFLKPDKRGHYLHTRRPIARIEYGGRRYSEESISIAKAGTDGNPAPPLHYRFFRMLTDGKEQIITIEGHGENRIGGKRETVDFEAFKIKIFAKMPESPFPIEEETLRLLTEKAKATGLDKYPPSSGLIEEPLILHHLKRTAKGTVWIVPSYEQMQPSLYVYLHEDNLGEQRFYKKEGPFYLTNDKEKFKHYVGSLEKTHSIQAVHWENTKMYPIEEIYRKAMMALKNEVLTYTKSLSPHRQAAFLKECFLVKEATSIGSQTEIYAQTNLYPLPLRHAKRMRHPLGNTSYMQYSVDKAESPDIIYQGNQPISTLYINIHRVPLHLPHIILGVAAQQAYQFTHTHMLPAFPLENRLGQYFVRSIQSEYDAKIHLQKEKNIQSILWSNSKGMYFISSESDAHALHIIHERIAFNPYDQKGKVWILKEDDIVQKPITKIFISTSIPSSEEKSIFKKITAYQKALRSGDTLVTREIDTSSPSLSIARQWYTAPPPSPTASSEAEENRPSTSYNRKYLSQILDRQPEEEAGQSTRGTTSFSSQALLTSFASLGIQEEEEDPTPNSAIASEKERRVRAKKRCKLS